MIKAMHDTAIAVADALRGQPIMLAFLILNGAFLWFFWWVLATVRSDTQAELALLRKLCFPGG